MSDRIIGSSAFPSLLRSEGVAHLFGKPGTTELPIMDALTHAPDLTYGLGLQEAVVVGMRRPHELRIDWSRHKQGKANGATE